MHRSLKTGCIIRNEEINDDYRRNGNAIQEILE
jgi:hypothetical protein